MSRFMNRLINKLLRRIPILRNSPDGGCVVFRPHDPDRSEVAWRALYNFHQADVIGSMKQILIGIKDKALSFVWIILSPINLTMETVSIPVVRSAMNRRDRLPIRCTSNYVRNFAPEPVLIGR